MTILDQVAGASSRLRYGGFRPESAQQYFALRLAAKLGESGVAEHYAELVEHHPRALLLVAYQRAVKQSRRGDLPRHFHEEFERLQRRENHVNGNGIPSHRLAAIRVDRRAISVAVFNGEQLAYVQTRQLSSTPGKAISSAEDFVERITAQFGARSAVVESVPNGQERQRKLLQQAIVGALADQDITTGELSKADLFEALAHPPARSRKELRQIASRIWPILDEQVGGPWTHDAAMLGLYVQVEVQFEVHN